MPSDCSSLDSLVGSGLPFAVFRLPGGASALYVQQNSNVETFGSLSELNGRSGFIVAPFRLDEAHPVVLIRPDLIVEGEGNLKNYLMQFGGKIVPEGVAPKTSVSYKVSKPTDSYRIAFELFQKALHAGSCEKIVLSRPLQVKLDRTFSAGNLFGAACLEYPDAMVYLCHTPATGLWMGCTPELLLSGNDQLWQTVALAGTQKMSSRKKTGLTHVEWDPKNKREQQIVTSYLEKQLITRDLKTIVSDPYTIQAGQVLHLKTDLQFELNDRNRVGDLLDSLHPTPAVCGYPKKEAYRLILAHEGYERAYYSGFIGPLEMEKKTSLYVNLRCAHIQSGFMDLFAGGGLMPDSDIQSEWAETENKLQTILSLMGRSSVICD
jgi:isochorismate synthase